MLEIEYGRKAWERNPNAAYAEALRRIRLTRDATDRQDRETIWFSDLGALKAIPPGLGEIEGLVGVEVGAATTPDGKHHTPRQTIASLAPLAEATGLRRLNLRKTGAKDLSPLARLTKLLDLNLGVNEALSDIAPLAACVGLQSLHLSGTQVADIAPLAACVGLQRLVLSDTQVADIAPLAACVGLQSLDLWGTQVVDIAPLAACGALQVLLLNETKVLNLAPLATCVRLQSLSLSDTQAADIAPLAACVGLQSLNLFNTQVADIAPLAACVGLQSLYLGCTQVADIAPLLRISHFAGGTAKALGIEGTPAAEGDPELGLISQKSPEVQAREVIEWLRGRAEERGEDADSEIEKRFAEASRVDLRLREGVDGRRLIAVDRLGPGGAGQVDPQAQAQRLDGLRVSVDDLLEDAADAAASGQVPDEFLKALRRYRARLDHAPVNLFELEPPIRRLDSALRSSDRGEFDQMMRPGFIGGLEALVTHHDDVKPYFEPPGELERRRDAALPPVRADADLEALRETVEDLREKMRALEDAKIADGSLADVADAAIEEIDAEKERPGEAQSRGRRIMRGLIGMAARLTGLARVVKEGQIVWKAGKDFFESEEWEAIREVLQKALGKSADLLADALDPPEAFAEDDDPEL